MPLCTFHLCSLLRVLVPKLELVQAKTPPRITVVWRVGYRVLSQQTHIFMNINRLFGQVVKSSASRAADPGFNFRVHRNFCGSNHTSDLHFPYGVNSVTFHKSSTLVCQFLLLGQFIETSTTKSLPLASAPKGCTHLHLFWELGITVT